MTAKAKLEPSLPTCDGCGVRIEPRMTCWCDSCDGENCSEAASDAVADYGTIKERAAAEIRAVAVRGKLLRMMPTAVVEVLHEIANDMDGG